MIASRLASPGNATLWLSLPRTWLGHLPHPQAGFDPDQRPPL